MRYVVLGGGVAGVACVEELRRVCSGDDEVTLVCPSDRVTGVRNLSRIGATLERFDVVEGPAAALAHGGSARGADAARPLGSPVVRVVCGVVTRVDAAGQRVHALLAGEGAGGACELLPYDAVCVCTGAAPRVLAHHPLVLGVRDAASIAALATHVRGARRVVVAGNGAIALGLVERLPPLLQSGGELLWAVRDGFVGATFFDASASAFLLGSGAAGGSAFAESFAPGTLAALVAATRPTDAAAAAAAAASIDARRDAEEARHVALSRACHFVHSPLGGLSGAPPPEFAGEAEGASSGSVLPPLPKRVRRRVEGIAEGNKRGAAHAASYLAPEQQAPALSSEAADAAHKSPAAAELFEAPPLPGSAGSCYGSALGDSWVGALKAIPLPCGAPGGNGAHGAARVTLEPHCEVVALRATPGTAGAVGCLADGAWHLLSELQEPAMGGGSGESGTAGVSAVAAGGALAGDAWPLYVRLSSGAEVGCDALLSPTGVCPVTGFLPPAPHCPRVDAGGLLVPEAGCFHRHADGGLLVNARMQTTGCARVYAAGDAAAVLWPRARATATGPPLWFQMRLWTQARVGGAYAARCMVPGALDALEADDGGVAFEAFAHATNACGYGVVLLGLFNGQGLGAAYERALQQRMLLVEAPEPKDGLTAAGAAVATAAAAEDAQPASSTGAASKGGAPWGDVAVQVRVTPGEEYAKVVLVNGRVVGAMLIGECTDLGETMENLMLNQLVVRNTGGDLIDLLDPDLDIEDFFD